MHLQQNATLRCDVAHTMGCARWDMHVGVRTEASTADGGRPGDDPDVVVGCRMGFTPAGRSRCVSDQSLDEVAEPPQGLLLDADAAGDRLPGEPVDLLCIDRVEPVPSSAVALPRSRWSCMVGPNGPGPRWPPMDCMEVQRSPDPASAPPRVCRFKKSESKEFVMRAAVVPVLGAPLEVQDVPVPDPGPDQILVRMEASGICHTDIHAARGDWPVKPTAPFIPGHEGVGIVEKLGAGVTGHALGDRVALPWLGSACGSCRYCVSGWETLCEAQQNTGYSIDGTYAEYAVADARFAVTVPEGVDPMDAAPLTCAGVTTYKAVKVSGARTGELVSVIGVGGLGHLAVQYAAIAGATVVAVDVHPDKLELAKQLGATYTVDASLEDPAAAIQRLGGADVAIALAVQPDAIEKAFASLRRGGRLVLVSLPKDGLLQVPVFDTVLKGISVIGSIVGTRQDLAEVFALHAAGRTRVVAEERSIEDINEAFEDVLAGRTPARLVIRM
jgi:alcohol dehydrogenase, propanol-preferring